MTAFPKYPKYKDSGVAWLGEVPEHWGVYPNRRLFEERKIPVGKRAHEYKLLSLTLNGVIPRDMENPKGKFPAEFNTYSEVEPNDLVFCLFDLDETPRTVGISPCPGMITGAYTIFKPKEEVNPKYQFYYYLSLDEQKALKPLYTGLRKTISRSTFASAKSPCPPLAEQDRIVAFLDEKTAQIDALIAKKQRQIELLEEQKAILINRAVTRGLNPKAQLQDSGIPWIGPIPKHWRVVPIKRMASVQNGVTLGPVYPVNMSSEVPYLRVANVQNGSLNLNVVATLRLPRRVAAKYLLQSGDVLVAEGGDLDKLGRGCVWRAELPYCIHQNHVFAVRTEAKRLLPEFLSTALGSRYGQRYFMLTGKQTTNLASTNSTSLMNFPLATPPVEEQERIMEELVRTQTAFERARSAITSQIQTLQTLRSTLIAHAVTGKIKV